jgi:hypothetical protein
MAFAEDLLDQAFLILNKETKNPKQASLRRAVSTAYDAVFHLFVQEACTNWNSAAVRGTLGASFQGVARAASLSGLQQRNKVGSDQGCGQGESGQDRLC